MAAMVYRLMDTATLSGGKSQDPDKVFDGGTFKQLMVVFYALATASSTGSFTLRLEHAAVNEDEQYLPVKDINGNDVEIDLKTASGNISFQVDGFLRYVRWTANDGGTAPSAAAIVGIDVVAKE